MRPLPYYLSNCASASATTSIQSRATLLAVLHKQHLYSGPGLPSDLVFFNSSSMGSNAHNDGRHDSERGCHGRLEHSFALARSLTSALANPYAELNHTPHYTATYAPRPHVNPQGYAYSSTYNPLNHFSSHSSTSWHSPTPSFSNPSSASGSRFPRGAPPTHWYAPGNSKCTHSGCTFTGSVNSVQTHMMDRHLIYPPGWNPRKRQPDWDADPSLKGYVLVHT